MPDHSWPTDSVAKSAGWHRLERPAPIMLALARRAGRWPSHSKDSANPGEAESEGDRPPSLE